MPNGIHIVRFGLALVLIGTGCHSYKIVDPVSFEKQIDTSDKDIEIQTKKTWSFGKIQINNTFDGARLNDVLQENDSTWIAYIKPENTPINPSPWYAFEISVNTAGTYNFILDYGENSHRYFPKVERNGIVSDLDSSDVHTVGEHRALVRMSIDSGSVILAGQQVVSSADVHRWMSSFAQKWSLSYGTYGKSRDDRPLNYLDINRGKKRKPLIVLLCRQHPPEVTGWFALQYFLQELMENQDLSKEFLRSYRILAYPVMNPDGVDRGFWRHNTGGVDLNRDWSQYRQPEVAQTVRHIAKLAGKEPVLLALDFHSTYHDIFYTNDESLKPSNLPGFKDQWLSALRSNYPEFQFEERNSMPQTPVSKNWFYRYFNATAITYEIGDDTPGGIIELKGRASARVMMKLLSDLSK